MRINDLKPFARNQSGSIMPLTAFMLIALLSVLGMTVTLGVSDHQRVVFQGALDSAVLAGASMADASDTDRIERAKAAFAGNLNANGFSTNSSSAFKATSVTPNFLIQGSLVSGHANLDVKNYFAGIIGERTVPMAVKAAARVSGSHPVCVLSLDDISPQGIEIYGTAQFTARNCAAQANSADGEGMKQYGNSVGRAKQFGVKGGYSGTGFVSYTDNWCAGDRRSLRIRTGSCCRPVRRYCFETSAHTGHFGTRHVLWRHSHRSQ